MSKTGKKILSPRTHICSIHTCTHAHTHTYICLILIINFTGRICEGISRLHSHREKGKTHPICMRTILQARVLNWRKRSNQLSTRVCCFPLPRWRCNMSHCLTQLLPGFPALKLGVEVTLLSFRWFCLLFCHNNKKID